jgi:HD-like signal output (HDOD) protein
MTGTSGSHQTLELTAEELVARLRRALGKDGDFPASAKVVSELRQLTSDPNTTANQITEVILQEPSLGMRLLSVVNSPFYQRGQPIMTVSQAVLRIGMKPLAELCAGLVLLQKFVPASRRGGAFATCLRKMLVTSLLASTITKESTPKTPGSTDHECGYLAGCLAEMGTLLLAYYFPQILDAALKRSESKKQDLGKSIFEITGLTPLKLSLEILNSLNLPQYYIDILSTAEGMSKVTQQPQKSGSKLGIAASALNVAQSLSDAVASSRSKKEIDQLLGSLAKNVELDTAVVKASLGMLPDMFKSHCSIIEVDLPAIPEFIGEYLAGDDKAKEGATNQEPVDPFKSFTEEIRLAVQNREPTASIITSVMEALVWGLKFDRALLMLVSPARTNLTGRMILGISDGVDPKKISRPIGPSAGAKACDAVAYKESRPVFRGTPVLENGWPFVAFPIGTGQKTIGIVYADFTNSKEHELAQKYQAAISVLTELLEQSVGGHS